MTKPSRRRAPRSRTKKAVHDARGQHSPPPRRRGSGGVGGAPLGRASLDRSAFAALRLVLTGLLLLAALAGFVGRPHLWGINHFAYLPLLLRILLPLLGLACIWTAAGRWFGQLLRERVATLLFERRWVAYGVLPLLGIGALWLLRSRLHCYGDGWLLGELVARGAPFHGFDFVDYHLHARLFGLLGLSSESGAFGLFTVMSTIAGGFYLAGAAWASRSLSADPGGRILLYALLLLFAPIQMFMGYVECYSLLAVFMLLFVAALAAHYRGRLTATWPALAFGGGLAFHLDALFLAPLLVPLVLWPPENSRGGLGRRFGRVLIPILAVFAVAVLLLVLEGYNRTLFELDFFKMRAGQRLLVRLTGEHGLLGWRHWRDVLNLLLLLAPVPLAMILAGLRRAGAARCPREIWVFAGGCLWLTLLLATIHMKLGVARDWDLFAAPAVIYVLTGYLTWLHLAGGRFPRQMIGMLVATAAILTLPWFWVNAGAERSLRRFEDAIGDQPDFARAYAHEEIGKHFRKQAEAETDEERKAELVDRALEEYCRTVEIFPSNPRFHGVRGALEFNSGDHAAAFESFRRVYEVDSTYPLGLEMLALLHAEREEWEEALPYSRKLAGNSREKPRSAAVHGLVAEQLGLDREAIDAYTRTLAKDQSRSDLLERIGGLGMRAGDHALAERAFRGVVRGQPTESARVGLVAAIWSALRGSPEQWQTADGRGRLEEAARIVEELIAEGRANRNIRQWGEEIQAALDAP